MAPGPVSGRVNSIAWLASSVARKCTAPSRTSTWKRAVQLSSGDCAQPLARPMGQLCSGHGTLVPNTMPWLRGRLCAGSGPAVQRPRPGCYETLPHPDQKVARRGVSRVPVCLSPGRFFSILSGQFPSLYPTIRAYVRPHAGGSGNACGLRSRRWPRPDAD